MNEFFEWNNTFDLGIGAMNEEHKVLINFMNRLHEEHQRQASKEVIAKCVQDLVGYTMSHFQDEEAFMARVGYAKIDTHKIIHKNLLTRLQGYIDGFQQTGTLKEEFFEFLQFWLAAHIRGIDMQYADHCRTGNVA